MSKLAILSDIHGNAVALRPVLAQIQRMDIAHLIVLGDIVGYYYRIEEVLHLLQELPRNIDVSIVRGNHEVMLEKFLSGSIQQDEVTKKYGHALLQAAANLPEKQLQYLINFPKRMNLMTSGRYCTFAHGIGESQSDYVYPDMPVRMLGATLVSERLIDVDFLFLGHTHYPMVRRCDDVVIVNPGSVGQSRQQGGVAEWCILNSDTGTIQPMATPYDVRPVIADVMQYDPDIPYLRDVLLR